MTDRPDPGGSAAWRDPASTRTQATIPNRWRRPAAAVSSSPVAMATITTSAPWPSRFSDVEHGPEAGAAG